MADSTPIQTYDVFDPELSEAPEDKRYAVIKKVTLDGQRPTWKLYLIGLSFDKAQAIAKAMNRVHKNVVGPEEREW